MGEPPLMYGIGAFFAIRNAIKAFNADAVIPFDAPMTPEKTLMALYSKSNDEGTVNASVIATQSTAKWKQSAL